MHFNKRTMHTFQTTSNVVLTRAYVTFFGSGRGWAKNAADNQTMPKKENETPLAASNSEY